mgnify:CR=1 FL=1
MGRTVRLVWRWLVRAWIVLPILAPGYSAWWWWTISSLGVIAVAWTQPHQRNASAVGWLIVGVLAVYLLHHRQPISTVASWALYATVLLVAAALIVERGDPSWVRQAVLMAAWGQLLVMAAQAVGCSTPWLTVGGGLTGTVMRRASAAGVVAMASCLTSGWAARVFAVASLWTTSLVGLPALLRLVPLARSWRWRLVAIAGIGWLGWMSWPRLLVRIEALRDATPLVRGWLTGWGFLQLPGGFVYDGGFSNGGSIRAPFLISDYHSAVLDWVARTGVLGAGMLAAMALWAWRRSQTIQQRWLFGLMLWIGCWQSVESQPVLLLLLMVWWMLVASMRRDHAPDSV